MDMRENVQNIINCYENTFTLGEEDPYPSSFWHEHMVMFSNEELPIDLRVYCSWNEFKERRNGGWTWYSPYHVFRLPEEKTFVLGHKDKEWIVYDKETSKIKKTFYGNYDLETYNTFIDAINTIYS